MKTHKKIKFKKNKINKTKIRGGSAALLQRAATLPSGRSTRPAEKLKRYNSLPTNYTKITIRPGFIAFLKKRVADIKKK